MKLGNLSLPHPVLGINDDVSGSIYKPTLLVTPGKKSTSLKISQELMNSTLVSMISTGKAVYCIQINCPQTLYRETFEMLDGETELVIGTNNLRNKVFVDFFIIAKTDISDYLIEGSNPDYDGYKFDIQKGDVLAFGASMQFLAVKNWDMLKGCKAFLQVERDDNNKSGPFSVFLSDEQIIIRLSSQDFDNYTYCSKTDYSGILHSSIVLPVLVYALGEMLRDKEGYEDCKWFQVLEMLRVQDENLKKIDWADHSNIPLIAQTLLERPLTRALTNLIKLSNSGSPEE